MGIVGEVIDGQLPDGAVIPPGKTIDFDGGPIFSALSFVATFFSPNPPSYEHAALAAGGFGVANNVVVAARIFNPFSITIASFVAEVTGQVAASTFGAAIYADSSDGSGARHLTTGGMSSAANGFISAAVGPFTLEPGTYIYAWNASNNTVTFRVLAAVAATLNLFNTGTGNVFTAANAAVAGACPATLGALTPVNAMGMLLGKFQA